MQLTGYWIMGTRVVHHLLYQAAFTMFQHSASIVLAVLYSIFHHLFGFKSCVLAKCREARNLKPLGDDEKKECTDTSKPFVLWNSAATAYRILELCICSLSWRMCSCCIKGLTNCCHIHMAQVRFDNCLMTIVLWKAWAASRAASMLQLSAGHDVQSTRDTKLHQSSQ